MQAPRQSGSKVLVVGLGKTGLSCARYLASRGLSVAVVDSRERPPGLAALREELPDVAVFTGGFEPRVFQYADELVVSPGVSLREPAIAQALAQGIPVAGDIELFARAVEAPVIAVTGSNGKSTVTSLVGEMARAAGRDVRVGGNLGTPALELLREAEPALYVLELSSFQLETTASLETAAAVVLNLSADHLDRYASLEEYAAAKARVYRASRTPVLNRDDPRVMAMAPAHPTPVTFGLDGAPNERDYGLVDKDGEPWLARGGEALIPQSSLRTPGRHNVANALAAIALGEAAGLERTAMLDALAQFPGLAHRTQWVGEADGVSWYNDSKGTNVGATLAAIAAMPGPVVLIAGGDGKGADFAPLRPVLARRGRAAVLIGRDGPRIAEALDGAVAVVHARDMDEAVARAAGLAEPGDAVLLSPACASLDMFRSYEERGEAFMAAARKVLP